MLEIENESFAHDSQGIVASRVVTGDTGLDNKALSAFPSSPLLVNRIGATISPTEHEANRDVSLGIQTQTSRH